LSETAGDLGVERPTPVLASTIVDGARGGTREARASLNAPTALGVSSASRAISVLEASVVACSTIKGDGATDVLEDGELTIGLVLTEGRADEHLRDGSSLTRDGESDSIDGRGGKVQDGKTSASIEWPVEGDGVARDSGSSTTLSPGDEGSTSGTSEGESVSTASGIAVAVVVHNHQVELRIIGGGIGSLSKVDENGVLDHALAHECSDLDLSGESSRGDASISGINNKNSIHGDVTSGDVSSKAAILGLSSAINSNKSSVAIACATRSAATIARAGIGALINDARGINNKAVDNSSLHALSGTVGLLDNEVTRDASIRHALDIEGGASSVGGSAELVKLVPESKVVVLDVKARISVAARRGGRWPHGGRRRGRRRRGRSIAARTSIGHRGRGILARGNRASKDGRLTKDTALSRRSAEGHLRNRVSRVVKVGLGNSEVVTVRGAERSANHGAS